MHGKQILLFNKKNIINISGEKGIRTIQKTRQSYFKLVLYDRLFNRNIVECSNNVISC